MPMGSLNPVVTGKNDFQVQPSGLDKILGYMNLVRQQQEAIRQSQESQIRLQQMQDAEKYSNQVEQSTQDFAATPQPVQAIPPSVNPLAGAQTALGGFVPGMSQIGDQMAKGVQQNTQPQMPDAEAILNHQIQAMMATGNPEMLKLAGTHYEALQKIRDAKQKQQDQLQTRQASMQSLNNWRMLQTNARQQGQHIQFLGKVMQNPAIAANLPDEELAQQGWSHGMVDDMSKAQIELIKAKADASPVNSVAGGLSRALQRLQNGDPTAADDVATWKDMLFKIAQAAPQAQQQYRDPRTFEVTNPDQTKTRIVLPPGSDIAHPMLQQIAPASPNEPGTRETPQLPPDQSVPVIPGLNPGGAAMPLPTQPLGKPVAGDTSTAPFVDPKAAQKAVGLEPVVSAPKPITTGDAMKMRLYQGIIDKGISILDKGEGAKWSDTLRFGESARRAADRIMEVTSDPNYSPDTLSFSQQQLVMDALRAVNPQAVREYEMNNYQGAISLGGRFSQVFERLSKGMGLLPQQVTEINRSVDEALRDAANNMEAKANHMENAALLPPEYKPMLTEALGYIRGRITKARDLTQPSVASGTAGGWTW